LAPDNGGHGQQTRSSTAASLAQPQLPQGHYEEATPQFVIKMLELTTQYYL